jgi:sulfatase modifying factor 1
MLAFNESARHNARASLSAFIALLARTSLSAFIALNACSAPQMAPDALPEAATADPAERASSHPANANTSEANSGETAPNASGEATAENDEAMGTAEPSACPAGMQLIDGDYCPEVEHTCKRQWYAKANKKEVCEEFEPESRCIGEKVKKRYCIDEYSWPNQRGERAEVMNNFYQAQVKCAAVGKRLCTESEWTLACEGPRQLPFPYGYVRDTSKCNGDREWDKPNMTKVAQRDATELARLWQGVRSGEQPECKSEYGVYDLAGNDDDVAASETYASNYRGSFDSVTTGGPWYKGVRNQCRPKIYTHDEGFYYYYLSFRCCAEPEGAPTDPRAPKQIKRGWDFEQVERLARFTQAEMRAKLELKKKGQCSCDAKDVLCKTMCGTLLGPNAKDAVLTRPAATTTPPQLPSQ